MIVMTAMAELKLNDLTKYNRRELDEMFLAAETPTMEEMARTLNGKVLAGTMLLSSRVLRWFLSLSWVPWKGKIFETLDGGQGKGINRFRVGPFRTTRFHCETEISPPLVGEDNIYRLNYDLRGNPWFIRLIRDDIKKLRDDYSWVPRTGAQRAATSSSSTLPWNPSTGSAALVRVSASSRALH